MGRSTRWLARELGPGYERESVHRDDLVVLTPRLPRKPHEPTKPHGPGQSGGGQTKVGSGG
jgi:hypothetical protein